MAAPRNNLDQLRAKFGAEAASPAPVAGKAQPTKTFKFKATGSAQAAPVVIPHAASFPPPLRSAPPAQDRPVSAARTGAQDQRRQAGAQKRPSVEGNASPSKPSPPKKARHHEPEPAPAPSSSHSRSRPRDVVMSDDATVKENFPARPLTPQSPWKKATVPSEPAPRYAPPATPSGSSPSKLKPEDMAPEQLRILLSTNLASELDYVKKLILVQKGEAGDQDAFLLERFAAALAERNEDLKRTLAEKSYGSAKPPVQANADLSQMSLEHLRALLIQNLSLQIEQTKAMLQGQGDIAMLEQFITILEQRNADTQAEIASREGRPPSSSSTPHFPSRIVQPVFAPAAPPTRYNTPTPAPTSKSRYVPPDVIDISDDSMEIEAVTTVSTVEKTRAVVQPPSSSINGPPLRAIENTVDTTSSSHVVVKVPARPAEPDLNEEAKKSPHSAEAHKVLRRTFQLQSFRPNQLPAITATLEGKDVFVLMPTGGGKSLCYMVPAVCQKGSTKGVSIVVTPLVALMDDQVDTLTERGVDAVAFNSGVDSALQTESQARLASCRNLPALAYVTPEKLEMSTSFINVLKKLHRQGLLARFVIDEVHCLATWGRDFRESYKYLSRLRGDYPGVPIMALTATAHKNNVDDIISQLNIDGCVRLTQSFNRTNLRYEIRRKRARLPLQMEDIHGIIQRYPGQTGIVYCHARRTCEEVAKLLRDKYRVTAKHYHGQMTPEDKAKAQKAWKDGTCKVIVATVAFGMGIDKANVRYVIHHTMPKSLECYYQETGRAGRDGLESECILFYAQHDFQILRKQIYDNDKTSIEEKKRQEEELRTVTRFCMNDIDCRRSQVLKFFGETFDPKECKGFCDNCKDSAVHAREFRDFTPQAQDAVRLVQELAERGDKTTQAQVVNIFTGSKIKEIKDRGFEQLEQFGKAGLTKVQTERLFDYLLVDGVFVIEGVRNNAGWSINYLKLGSRANVKALLDGKQKVRISVKAGSAVHVEMGETGAPAKGKRGRKPGTTKAVNRKRQQENPYDTEEDDPAPGGDGMSSFLVEDDDPIVQDDDDDEYGDVDWGGFDELDDEIVAFDGEETTFVDENPAPEPKKVVKPSSKNKEPDVHEQCYQALIQERNRIANEKGMEEKDVASGDLLGLLATMLPTDMFAFLDVAKQHFEDNAQLAQKKWPLCKPLLDVCVKYKMANFPTLADIPPESKPAPPATKILPPSRTASGNAWSGDRQIGSSLSAASKAQPAGSSADKFSKFKFKKP